MPTEVKALHPNKHKGARVIAVAGGEFHNLFLFDNGSLFGCGRTDGYELGLDDRHPAMIRAREQSMADMAHIAQRKMDIKSEESTTKPKAAFIAEPVKIAFPFEGEQEACIEQIVCSKRQ